ncbi:HAD family hydrolase [Sinanaerobacter chloroacetimidivorans]|jgi:phosphoglycolate phosphatase|uniref:HAD family hydrolase n=1 Tax=Sinanaerobacter chloroacetimidivorans TaxID=2818044 RepID=A0A8J7VZZ5_9FIRM|nr:HAD family hydrolase [Sinanaerobacter chloroacetimidivorans]MBR0596480.1 HAD family hydrolase [Sinanaerobacter chloroacetimidivorans]
MKIDSIIFDLDGTLWNTAKAVCSLWNTILKNYPHIKKSVTIEEVEGCMGLQTNEIGRKLFPNLHEDTQHKLMDELCEAELSYLGEHGGVLYPKLEETLNQLIRKYKLFIVSNCQDGYIQCFLKAHKLDQYFVDFECSGATGLPKGENNKLIIQRNSLKSPVYVGDTNGDAESAKVAEIPFVYARYGFGKVEKYDYVIDGFEEILRLK